MKIWVVCLDIYARGTENPVSERDLTNCARYYRPIAMKFVEMECE